jgi:TonB family protein
LPLNFQQHLEKCPYLSENSTNCLPSWLGMQIATQPLEAMVAGMFRNLSLLRGVVGIAVLALAGSAASGKVNPPRISFRTAEILLHRERMLRDTPEHDSEYSSMAEPTALPRCGETRLPEALLTPDPLLQSEDDDLHVRVSFIVGADGHVHSPFILDSGGRDQDELVLRTVQHWRYRPALCNGVPTDAEARVEFRIR